MESWKQSLLGGVALVGAGLLGVTGALAQSAALPGGVVPIQQSAARADAASIVQGNTKTSCTTSQDSVANLTIAVVPPAGNFFYMTELGIQVASTTTTGSSSTVSWNTTNFAGTQAAGPTWLTANSAGTGTTVPTSLNQTFPTGLKANATGTVTLTPSATMASAAQCVQMVGWFSPL